MAAPPTPNDSHLPACQAELTAETPVPSEVLANTGMPSVTRPNDTSAAPTAETPVPVASASLLGRSFGDFELLAEVGRGGMGIVYQARQKSLDRLVALKLLPADHFPDPIRLARFLTEARAAASLSHPNIVQVYQVGECPAGHYFAMEFIAGPQLETLARNGNLSIKAAVGLLIPVAEAVHYAHTRGIIHRDLKPANILVDPHHRPVVTDFGIAKVIGQSPALTQRGVIIGTPAYMSPEQAGEETAQIGPHSDVYSLGAILYTLLAGRAPYDEGSALRTILKVMESERPPPIRPIRPQVPHELEHICLKCLRKRPEDRYPSAQALADELRRFRITHGRSKQTSSSTRQPRVVLVAEGSNKEVRLSRSRTIIGRASECGLILRAADVSKQHCQILVEGDQILVEDLGSANGTFVNDRPIQRARLRDGDQLRIVRYLFRVHLPPLE